MNNGNNGRGMSPRDRYFAEKRAAEEAERKRLLEAERQAAEARRQAELLAQKRAYEAKLKREKALAKKRRAEKARMWRTRMLVFFVIFIVVFAIAVLCIFISFNARRSESIFDKLEGTDYRFIYVFGEEDDEYVKWTQSGSYSLFDGVLYIDFTKLSGEIGMSVVGSGDEIKFVTENGAENVKFTVGGSVAEVNGTQYRMDADAKRTAAGAIIVPLSFVSECVKELNVSIDTETDTVTLEKTGNISFVMKPDDEVPTVKEETDYGDTTTPPETDPIEDEIPEVTFKADLSDYEIYMDPADRDAYLVLVNSENLLSEDDDPTDLVDVVNTRDDGRNTQQLRLYAAKALEALFIELYENGYTEKGPGGYPVTVMSAYRSYSYQKKLFNSYVEREMNDDKSLTRAEAEKITETYSARPGTSEHQTGLCIDMHNLSSAKKAFANEEEYEWLVENSWKFGFILRFPDGKTDITGITYEPWHYRYVGRYHAYKIMSEGLCLEEYIASLDAE